MVYHWLLLKKTMCMNVLPMYEYCVLAWCPRRLEQRVASLDLELPMVMSHIVSVEAEQGSSASETSAFDH